jgi:NAD(P)-dependent dehydrogenase (short-subunit alcohol dehydrogenase family)
MKLENATVLVTGANRGLGLEFARQALAAGARKVYAGARDPASVTLPGTIPVRLDVNDPAQVAEAAAACSDVTLVINNAGIARMGGLLEAGSIESLGAMFDTNVSGLLRMSQAFAPVLARNGSGAFLNVLSVASWISTPGLGAYAATKSAAWSLTNGLRIALQGQGTQVLGLHVGFIDTDLTRGIDLPKLAPSEVVEKAFAALEAGQEEVLIDELSRRVKQGLAAEPAVYLAQVAAERRVAVSGRPLTAVAAPIWFGRLGVGVDGVRHRQMPVVAHRGQPQHEAEQRAGTGHRGAVPAQRIAHHHHGGPGQRRYRIYLGAHHGRDLGQQHVARDAAADPGQHAEQRRHERLHAEHQRLLGAGHAEQRQAGGVEHQHGIAQVAQARVPEEDQHAGQQRGRQVAPVADRSRRRGADQEVAHDAARIGGNKRQHQHAEQIEPAAHAGHGAAEGEHEGAQQVEGQHQGPQRGAYI